MIIHIAKKEVLEHLKSFRFLVAFLFILTTFFIMMFTRHFDYRSKYDDYLLRIKTQEEALEKYAHRNSMGGLLTLIVPPSPMETIVDPVVESADGVFHSLDEDPFDTFKINLDIVALVGLLGSLLALLLSYDSINREIHEGTMRLLLSSGVPRIKIIIGKILGGSMAAVLPIATIFIIASMWLALTGGLAFGLNLWMSFLGIFLLSIVYIMFFYCVGAFLSSVVLDQTLSVLSCFGVWVMFAIVVPVVSPDISKSIAKVPHIADLERQVKQVYEEREKAINRRLEVLMAEQNLPTWEMAYNKNQSEMNALSEVYEGKEKAIVKNYENAMMGQVKLSIRLSCISPYSMYQMAVEELSGLGFVRFEHVQSLIPNYRQKAFEYGDQQHNEAIKRDPNYTLNSKLDLSGMPRFQYIEPRLSIKYSSALPYMLLLMGCFLVPMGLYLVTFNSRRRLF